MSTPYFAQLSRTALLYLMAVLVASTALMYRNMPPWISGAAMVFVIWRLFIFSGKLSFPPLWLKATLVFFSMAGAFLQYRYSLSLDLFASILMLGFSLKLLEVYHKQAAQLLLYLAVFVLMTYLLYEQTLSAGIFTCLQMLLIVAALITVNSDAETTDSHFLQPVKKSGLILFIALPIMAAIFLFMPRLNPLWIMPLQTQQAKTGMSDQMSPGDITRLANSPELVFRASFEGPIPPKKELYWQGFMFDEFDGRQWKNNCDCNYSWKNSSKFQFPSSAQNAVWNYQIMMEPHGNRWIFALPDTFLKDDRIRFNGDNLFRTRREVTDKMVYEGWVFKQANVHALSQLELKRYIQLPKQGNPKAYELAQSWRAKYKNDADIVQEALKFYNASLSYTLSPPALGVNSIDDFLFVTQKGFCEHFAGSFVFLMRAAGIPSRVILGYQGGEINRQDNYVVVRQYDAHAWAQVWLPNQGWVKVDPTAAVNPARIDAGFETAFANSPVLNSPLNLTAYRNINLLNLLRIKLDYLDYAWSRWVVGYNANAQNNLLNRLGLTSPFDMLMWIITLAAIILVIFILFLWMRDRHQQYEHPLTSRYRKLMMVYAHLGLARSLCETPLQFAQRVKENNLPFCDEFMAISTKYNDWFCGKQISAQSLRALKYECLYWQMRLSLKSAFVGAGTR